MPLVEIIVPSIPSNVPAFLAKLWKMVENQDTGEGEGREGGLDMVGQIRALLLGSGGV